jgi:hypothetical protein
MVRRRGISGEVDKRQMLNQLGTQNLREVGSRRQAVDQAGAQRGSVDQNER